MMTAFTASSNEATLLATMTVGSRRMTLRDQRVYIDGNLGDRVSVANISVTHRGTFESGRKRYDFTQTISRSKFLGSHIIVNCCATGIAKRINYV